MYVCVCVVLFMCYVEVIEAIDEGFGSTVATLPHHPGE